MTRALIPALALLCACAPATLEEGFEADLTEVCAARSLGDDDVSLYAADPGATVKLWVYLEGVLGGLDPATSSDQALAVGDGAEISVTTGENLREGCSDLAMNEVQDLHYAATSGTLDVALDPYDDDGEPTWLATVTLTDVVLEPEEGGDAVDLTEFTFDAVEIWER